MKKSQFIYFIDILCGKDPTSTIELVKQYELFKYSKENWDIFKRGNTIP